MNLGARLHELHEHYRQLLNLAEMGLELLRQGEDEEPLEHLWEKRHMVLSRIQANSQQLFGSDWQETVNALGPEQRGRAEATLADIQAMGARIMEIDSQCKQAIAALKAETSRQLEHINASRQAHNAYNSFYNGNFFPPDRLSRTG